MSNLFAKIFLSPPFSYYFWWLILWKTQLSSKTIEYKIVTGSNNKMKPLCDVHLQLLLVLSSSVLQIFPKMIFIGLTSSLKSSTVLANLFLTFLFRVAGCIITTAKGITNPQRKTRIDARAWTTSTAEPKTATGTNKGYCRFIFASCGLWDCATPNTVRVTATEMVPIRKSFGCKNLAKKIGSITNGIKTIQYCPFYSDVKRTLFNSSSDGVILLYKVAHAFWSVDSCDVCLRHHLQTTTSKNWGRNIKLRNEIGQSLCCLDSRFVEHLLSKTLDRRNKSSFASFKIRQIF